MMIPCYTKITFGGVKKMNEESSCMMETEENQHMFPRSHLATPQDTRHTARVS